VEKSAWVEMGATWNEVDAETTSFGLYTTGGTVSSTGMGLALGGGVGWAVRKCGLVVDNILAAHVILADGSWVYCDTQNNEDLFWAIRGGGGNYGIVTEIKLKLYDCPPVVYGGVLYFDAKYFSIIFQVVSELNKNLPREANMFLFSASSPVFNYESIIYITIGYLGPPSEAEATYSPLLKCAPLLLSTVGPLSYVKLNQIMDPLFPSASYRFKCRITESDFGEHLTLAMTEIEQTRPKLGLWMLEIWKGGVAEEKGEEENAWGLRKGKLLLLLVESVVDPKKEDVQKWMNVTFSGKGELWLEKSYFNHNSEKSETEGERALAGNYVKAQLLKKKFDPNCVFWSSNVNVKLPK